MSGIKKGSHVAIACSFGPIEYDHHAIYIGDGKVIERSQNGVHVVPYSEFRGRGQTVIVKSEKCFTKDEIVARAYSRLRGNGTTSYDRAAYSLLSNNCEHFANWCRSGNHVSPQLADRVR
jgi:anaerobic selenocysteine-containing dehydrogenase